MNAPEQYDSDWERDEALGSELEALFELQSSSGSIVAPENPEVEQLRPVIERLRSLSATANRSHLPPEKVGKYHVERQLGQGGQSTVFLAFDPDLKRSVVLKLYHETSSRAAQQAVLNEAQSLARVRSPYVAQCYGVERAQSQVFLVMEYVPGHALDQLPGKKRLPIQQAIKVVAQVALGLSEVHRHGLIHRDVKPANIILGADGRPKLVDFGLAVSGQDSPQNRRSGTPTYMAPEQANDQADQVGTTTDVFGLGTVLYELLVGQAPYQAESREASLALAREVDFRHPRASRPRIPRSIESVCLKCMAASPGRRYQTTQQVRRALRWAGGLRFLWGATLTIAILAGLTVWFATTDRDSHSRVPSVELPPELVELFFYDGHPRHDFELNATFAGASRDSAGVFILEDLNEVHFRITAGRDCYLSVWAHSPSVARLYPRLPFESKEDTWLLRNEPKVVPSPHGDVAPIQAVASGELEFVCIMATTAPLDLGASGSDPRILVDRLRGLVRPSNSGLAISQVVLPYRVIPNRANQRGAAEP